MRHRGYRANRRALPRQIFGDEDRVELFKRTVRQPIPDVVATEQLKAEVAANGKRLPIGADRHDRAVDVPVARIEDVAALVPQAVPPHVSDDRQPKQRGILTVVPATRTDRVARAVARSLKQLCSDAFVDAATIDEQEPYDRLTARLVDLLPQTGCRGSLGRYRLNASEERDEPCYDQPGQLPCRRVSPIRSQHPN